MNKNEGVTGRLKLTARFTADEGPLNDPRLNAIRAATYGAFVKACAEHKIVADIEGHSDTKTC